MERELEEELARRWPEIFRGRNKPPTESLMGYGCTHGDGWYPIVDAICEVLTEHARVVERDVVEAVQIKEKLAGMRFYVAGAVDEFERSAIQAASELSGRICEVSGLPGHLFVRGGRYRTLAPEIAEREGFSLPDGLEPPTRAPIPWHRMVGNLTAEQRSILVGPVDIPAGWYDVGSVMLRLLAKAPWQSGAANVRVLAICQSDGHLVVDVENSNESDEGVIAFARAISKRVDPVTGAAHVPNRD